MKRASILVLALSVLAMSGCVAPVTRQDVPRLLAHPQAKAAAQAAPDFFSDAMNTIARLDHELNSRTP